LAFGWPLVSWWLLNTLFGKRLPTKEVIKYLYEF